MLRPFQEKEEIFDAVTIGGVADAWLTKQQSIGQRRMRMSI